jgi:hypothetical protein
MRCFPFSQSWQIAPPKLSGSPSGLEYLHGLLQAMLFADYLHVHYQESGSARRVQAAIHLALVLAATTLPIGLSSVSNYRI